MNLGTVLKLNCEKKGTHLLKFRLSSGDRNASLGKGTHLLKPKLSSGDRNVPDEELNWEMLAAGNLFLAAMILGVVEYS